MAGKRQATSHLDHENWEQEDEPEERGTFKTAPPDELKARVIKKATRRQAATGATKDGDAVDSPSKSVFSGFSGFGKPGSASASAGNAAGSPFAFLAKLPATAVTAASTDADCFAKPSSSTDVKRTSLSNIFSLDGNFRNDFQTSSAAAGVASSTTTATTTSTSIFGNASTSAVTTTKSPIKAAPMFKSTVNSVEQSSTNSSQISVSMEHRDALRVLNLEVMKFLQEHMDKDPHVILTPVFRSYDRFLKELEERFSTEPTSSITAPTSVGFALNSSVNSTATPSASTAVGFSFGNASTSTISAPSVTATTSAAATGFKFGIASKTTEIPSSSSPAAGFSFGIKSAEKAAPSSPAGGLVFGKSSNTPSSEVKAAPAAVGFSFGIPSTTATEKASSSLTAAPTASFSFLKPSTPVSSVSASETASPSLSFDKKPNCTVTSGGTTTTITAPLFSLGSAQTTNVSPTKSEATSSTTPAASIFSLGVKSTSTDSIKGDAPKTSFFFGANNSDAADASSAPKSNGLIFGIKSSDDKPSTSGFTGFGKPDSADASSETKMPASTGFSFGSATSSFSFGNVKPPTAADIQAAEKEEEDTPPVVQFKQVVEDDAIYSKRCKVFVKKGTDYTDRGVGTLYLKPVKDTEKTQLLVRADTNLGNILVNLILTEGLPSQRMGKNNVMMVCIPTPEETKPLSILLRVKTAEEADDLLEQIKKYTV